MLITLVFWLLPIRKSGESLLERIRAQPIGVASGNRLSNCLQILKLGNDLERCCRPSQNFTCLINQSR